MPGNEAELKGSLRANAKRDDWSEVVLLGGLFLEVALLFVFSRDRSWIETGSLVFANVLVFLGVFGSWHFGGKARRDGEELQRLSEEAIAVSNRIAEEARERTAKIERLTAGRHISPKQRKILAEAIRDKSAEIDLLVEFQRDDVEAYIYADECARAFHDAGVEKIRCLANSYLSGMVFGVHIALDLELDRKALGAIFSDARAPLVMFSERDLSTHLPRNEVAPNLYVFIGPKPPPEWAINDVNPKRDTDSNRDAVETEKRTEDAEGRISNAEEELIEMRRAEREVADRAAWDADWNEGRE